MANKCSQCGNKFGFFSKVHNIHGKEMCSTCVAKYIKEGIKNIIVTTTHSVDGYYISSYLGIESVEIVIGTGVFSEFSGNIDDFFGRRSTGFEKKLATAKKSALEKLKFIAFEKGANAVVGVDLDYTEFSGNRIALIINGTLVSLKPNTTKIKGGQMNEND